MTRYTVAVDPGTATGIAVWDDELGELSPLTGQYDKHELFTFLNMYGEDISHMRIEAFAITAATIKKARVMDPIWYTGACMFNAWKFGFEISFSKPADVMRRFPDQALKQAGWYNKSEHARDALRHLASRLISEKTISAAPFML